MKYTKAQVKELAKMGVIVNEEGDYLGKPTKLQTTLKRKKAIEKDILDEKISMTIPLNKSTRYSPEQYFHLNKKSNKQILFRRVNQDTFTEEERLERGLVTKRKPNVNYLLLSDNTKVCRCCQHRKPGNYFSANSLSKDNKRSTCKDCDYIRVKTYLEEKKQLKVG